MDLKEFERQVLAGEITDFEPCFEKLRDGAQMEQRYILAKNGIETDRVSGMDGYNTIVDIINEGLLPERYEEWKHHPRADVRQALVDNGHFYDYLINDENQYIRRQIIEKDIRLGLGRLDNNEDRAVVRRVLKEQTNDELELDILKAYLDAEEKYGDAEDSYINSSLKLKYEALTTTPTTIERTMTPAQLYVSESPLWVQNYTVDEIESILPHLINEPKTEESFNTALKKERDWQQFINGLGSIGGVHGN